MKENDQENVIKELEVARGEKPTGGVFKIVRGFRLQVRNGPLIDLKKGQRVELSAETAALAFSTGQAEPVDVPERFKVCQSFKTVENGLYVTLRINDLIEIKNRSEALDLWRKGFVKPIYSSEVKNEI
jgi:hypothetical protein